MENKSLYAITAEYRSLMQEIEECEGVLTPELEEGLQINKEELIVKSENYVHVIKSQEAYLSAIDNEIKRLQALKKQKEKAVDILKSYLLQAVENFGTFTSGFFTFSTRKNSSVEVFCDTNDLPKEFKSVKVTETADKTAIKKALQSGITIEGCAIIEKHNLAIK
jgi:hypothetical protein